jgi:hypothetical protein
MNPEYLQVPEPSQQSFATSVGGDSNEIATGTDRLNRRSWPGMSAHTPNRLSVSSQFPEMGPQLSAFGSIATNRASLVSLPDGPGNPLSFIYADTGTAVEAPSSGVDFFQVLSELGAHGGGESRESGSSYGNTEGLSVPLNLLVNESLQRLVNLQAPYKIWKFGWRNKFREILADTKPIPDHILEKVRLDYEPIVHKYESRHQSVKELALQEAFQADLDFETSLTEHYLESTEQVLATFCQIEADTMIKFTYEFGSQVARWVFEVEEGTEPLTETESVRSTDSP